MTSKDVYVVMQQIGECRICGQRRDLRCGACWTCMPQVAGERLSPTTHRLWDSRNPSNEWVYAETHN